MQNDSEDFGLSVKACEPKNIKEYPFLSEAIKKGYKLHSFRSGGGLRVVTLQGNPDLEDDEDEEDDDVCFGYGEHPYVYNALDHAEENCSVGGRKYKEMYGGLYDHYVTGSSNPGGSLDSWVLCGRSFDIYFENGKFIFKSEYMRERGFPQEVKEEVDRTGKPVCWQEDGLIFEAKPCTLPNGEKCDSISCVNAGNLKGSEVWLPRSTVTFEANTFADLLNVVETEFITFVEGKKYK